MYTAKLYRIEDPEEIKRFLYENGFATVVTSEHNRITATHIPLELVVGDDGKWLLQGHFSRANEQWKQITPNKEILAIFLGPHTYISPRWYNHVNVPTWNYMAVHCYGTGRILEKDELRNALRGLVEHYEGAGKESTGYAVDTLPPDYLQVEMKAIVGFEMLVTRVEASYKLSQNRDAENYDNVVKELEKRNDPASTSIAEEMKRNRPRRF
jgi:transcriptional regulator